MNISSKYNLLKNISTHGIQKRKSWIPTFLNISAASFPFPEKEFPWAEWEAIIFYFIRGLFCGWASFPSHNFIFGRQMTAKC